MKAAIATGIQDFDKHINIDESWPQPTLETAKDGKTGKPVSKLAEKHMIVKVLACGVAPGDCRLFKGKTDMMQLPKWGRPYVIGSDICGIVTEVGEDESYYKLGDKIIARFDEPQPQGMCAEYVCVKTHLSEKCPASIPATEACTLASSASAAKLVIEKFIQKDSRVLLLGGSGGLGTFMCQYIKKQGASFLAATTTQSDLVKSLGVDRVIDYRVENWWELEKEFGENPFDVVVDLVNGQNWVTGACSGTTVLKSKAPYVQMFTGVETEIDMGMGIISVIPFIFSLLGRSLYSKLHRSCPKYITPKGLELKPGHLEALLEDIADKKVKVVLDPAGPFEFTTEGVRAAMKLQNSIHAHGKVVIEIAKDEQSS
ncbi:furan-3-one reductase [Seminavis robusta]|uniref:Furan-3-one reductase n=1 Tax=Seminavis robusta TaxID=568900 RepID=A0A9N8E0H9_9STRA|nr:furan-3-one reductase [Seminavis robusta]|eukprot:Sro527_g160560.1 furan-3-one reductase (371) ;mRNA; f:5835-6947